MDQFIKYIQDICTTDINGGTLILSSNIVYYIGSNKKPVALSLEGICVDGIAYDKHMDHLFVSDYVYNQVVVFDKKYKK